MKPFDSEKAMKLLKKLFPYYMFLMAVFLLVPLWAYFSDDEQMVKLVVWFSLTKINFAAVLFSSILFGVKHGFTWAYPVVTLIIFLIAMLFYFFSLSYLMFAGIYLLLAMAGCWVGTSFKKHRDEMYL